MKIDWKLKGFNLLKFVCNKSLVLHPETCSNMVLMDHDSDLNLKNWITGGSSSVNIESSLGAWLIQNYSSLTVPYAGNDTLDTLGNIVHHAGVVYPGEGLSIALNDDADIPGELKINAATSDKFGGIKLGYTAADSNVPVQVDAEGRAFVTVTGGSADCIIYRWDENNPTHITPSPAINPSAYIVNEGADNFASINIADYITTIKNLFNTSVNQNRIYPIRTDVLGHLYTFVPWTDTTYNIYNGGTNGLVPNAPTSGTTVKFLRADGNWVTPSYNDLTNKPSTYTGNTAGFVPAAPATGANIKYLRGDGQWVTPPDTTYASAMRDNPEGLLNVSDNIANSTAVLADNSSATTTYTDQFIPVIYNEDSKLHGSSLKLILDTILSDTKMLRALATAIVNDTDGTNGAADILKAFINP